MQGSIFPHLVGQPLTLTHINNINLDFDLSKYFCPVQIWMQKVQSKATFYPP